jgi:DNA-binding NarL/FixJ family response regulator
MTSVSKPRSVGTPAPLRILLVDDHPSIRHGLTELLRHEVGIAVIGDASSGEEAVEKASALRPDVVVMDLAMPGIGGIEATRRIRTRPDASRVVVLTSDTEEESLLDVLAVGGNGYVRKARCHKDLLPAIRVVARDEVFLYPGDVPLLLRACRSVPAASGARPPAELSEQEKRVCTLAAAGYSSRSIGTRLRLAPHAVDAVRAELMRKLGLQRRAGVAALAARAGLLPAPSPDASG